MAFLISAEASTSDKYHKVFFSNHSILKKANNTQPHYPVEALLRFKQQLNPRDECYGMNTDYAFTFFKFPFPISHSPFLILAISICHAAHLGVAFLCK